MANRTAVIQTNKGTIRVELLESDAPKTTENFITLAERGYYDGIIFHRVIKGFMIQGGDPTGTGRGRECCGRRAAGAMDCPDGERLAPRLRKCPSRQQPGTGDAIQPPVSARYEHCARAECLNGFCCATHF